MNFSHWLRIVSHRSTTSIRKHYTRLRLAKSRPALERLEERTLLDGNLDTTFGTMGVVSPQFLESLDNLAQAVAVQTDGKIVVAGQTLIPFDQTFTGPRTRVSDISLARYNADGSLDASFGMGGKVESPMSTLQLAIDLNARSSSNALALEPNGDILLVGTVNPTNSSKIGVARYTPTGSLDTTFGTGGVVTISFPNVTNAIGTSIVVLSDGRFVVAGSGFTMILLARFNADGTLDTSFGTSGQVVTPLHSGGGDIVGLAVQPDGNIIAGMGTNAGTIGLARYTTAGTLDTSFGTGGTLLTNVRGNGNVGGIAVEPDGRIVVAGSIRDFTTYVSTMVLARYQTDGTLDSAFGTAGILRPSFMNAATGVAVQSDGQIDIVGGLSFADGNPTVFRIARLNELDGSLDTSFGTGGIVDPGFASVHDFGGGLVLQGSNIIAVGGTAGPGTGDDFAVTRLLATGALDPTFNGNGRATTDFVDWTRMGPAQIVPLPDDKFVLVGNILSPAAKFGLERFNADGTLDTTFGQGRRVEASFGGSDDVVRAILQPDGKILVACTDGVSSGSVTFPNDPTNTRDQFALARFNNDGSVDTSFGMGGQVLTPYGDTVTAQLEDMTLGADGKISVVGQLTSSSGIYVYTKVRYNADGSFSSALDLGLPTRNGILLHIAVQADGRAIVSGADDTNSFLGHKVFVLQVKRFNVDGSLDADFGTGGIITIATPGYPPADGDQTSGDLLLQTNGKIVIHETLLSYGTPFCPICSPPIDTQAIFFRYNSDGTEDTSWTTSTDEVHETVLYPPSGHGRGTDNRAGGRADCRRRHRLGGPPRHHSLRVRQLRRGQYFPVKSVFRDWTLYAVHRQ
jgi:uncharacterized delta-60 repeat protein